MKVANEYIVINDDLRTMQIPSSITILGVESDDDVNKIPFKMPKEYCGFDLSTFEARINYMNANGIGDLYIVDDLAVDGDDPSLMTFTWLVGRNACAYKGNTKFIVCLKKFDENDNVVQEFNTTVYNLPVLEGLETTDAVEQQNADVIEQILTMLQDAGAVDLSNYYTKAQVDALKLANPYALTINGTEYDGSEAVELEIEGGASQTTETVSGALLHVTDAVPNTAAKSLKPYASGQEVQAWVCVANKNLFRLDQIAQQTISKGITFEKQSDGAIHATGTSTGTYAAASAAIDRKAFVVGETYTISSGKTSGVLYVQLQLNYTDNTTDYLVASNSPYTFTLAKEVSSVTGSVQITNSGVTIDEWIYPMIEVSDMASVFTNNYYANVPVEDTEPSNVVLPDSITNIWADDTDDVDYFVMEYWNDPVMARINELEKQVNQTIEHDGELNATSEKAVQNKVVTAALLTKLDNPSGGTSGQVLIKTEDGTAWQDGSNVTASGTKMAVASYVGKLFDTGFVYSSWVHNNVKYDATNDVICVMVNCADAHADATYRCVVLYKVNPRTLKVEDVITVNDSRVSGDRFECYGFSILSNGTYMFLPCYDTAVASESSDKLIVWQSADYGTTWASSEATVSGLATQSAYEWFGLTALASGRLLCTEYKTKSILYSDDNGETWTAQKMSGSTHEPTFVDCGDDRILCICRKTMYGTSNGAWNGTKQIEPAVYHTSTDGGATWTYKGNSKTITEMTACNCAVAVVDGYADLYVCSRMPHGDSAGVVYHYFASLDDAFNDQWGTSKVLFYPSAPTAQDFSYLGVAVDGENIQHIFYYDTDTTNEAEIRYLMASATGIPVPVNSDKSKALSIPYSREYVDSMLGKTKAQILSILYDYIISEGGEIPDSGSGMDGSYYVTDNLYEYFNFMNESKYDVETYSQTGELGVFSMKRSSATYGDAAPEDSSFSAWNNIVWRTNGKSFADIMTVANGYSIEMLLHNDKANYAASTGSSNVIADSNNQYGRQFILQSSGSYHYGYYTNTNSEQGQIRLTTTLTSGAKPIMPSGKEWSHLVIVQTSESISIYQNGVLTMKKVYADLSDFSSVRYSVLQGVFVHNANNQYHATKMRYYKKALTAEEVKNNYTYEMNVAE